MWGIAQGITLLERIRLIQIGDIHFPQTASEGLQIDDKDSSFPQEMKNGLSRYPLKTVFRRIYELLERRTASQLPISSILFMGDATSYGDLEGYQQCMEFVCQSLRLGKGREFGGIHTGIIPGNHDIDRKLLAIPGSDKRFYCLSQMLATFGLPAIPVDRAVKLQLSQNKSRAKILLLNSCLGCGQKKYIPSHFSDALHKAIEDVISLDPTEAALKQYFDLQLDTPAIDKMTIDDVVENLANAPKDELLIIAAHHNLLPQRSIRLAQYTEMVNGGVLRDALVRSGRPIIYLHGHIHDDPIEVVMAPNGYPVLTISAPEAKSGFNVIEILFDSQNVPLSCNVYPYRFGENGIFNRQNTIKIPLISKESFYLSKAVTDLYLELQTKKFCRIDDLVTVGSKLTQETVIETLETLSACGLVNIKNYSQNSSDWILEALTK